MPSVYNYRHVELDKVGRGKRVIQPPGGQTADIFGRSGGAPGNYSSASSQAGSDVASSRVHIETDQQSIASISSSNQTPVDGVVKPQQQTVGDGQVSPSGSVSSASVVSSIGQPGQAPLLMPTQGASQMSQQYIQSAQDGSRTPKKSIPVIRRNPITGEIYNNPTGAPQPVVRVRQPPGGRSSGIF